MFDKIKKHKCDGCISSVDIDDMLGCKKTYGSCYNGSAYERAPDSTTEAKHDTGKPRPTLVPPSLIRAVTEIREYGCKKYHDPENWRKIEPQRYQDALYRHWLAYLEGEVNDPESGLPHIWHCATNIAFLIELEGSDFES